MQYVNFFIYFCRKNTYIAKKMAESAIITGQYVRLQPTVASVGDRILAQILDWIVLFAYVMLAIIIAADIIKTEWYYIITIGVKILYMQEPSTCVTCPQIKLKKFGPFK